MIILKRLLCIVSSLDMGGAETFLMKINRSLPSSYRMDFIVSTNEGVYEEEVKKLGGRIFRIPLRTSSPIKSYKALKKIVSDHHYDYVLKLCDTPIGYFDLLACKKGGATHLCVRSCNASSQDSFLRKTINNILRKPFNRIATTKIAPSSLAGEYTFGKNEDFHLLHNGLALEQYRFNKEERERVRKEWNIENTFVIGHIGRFSHQKNHDYLLDIFEEVRKEKNARLMLIGEGELLYDIKERAQHYKDEVIFCGLKKNIPSLLSAMDLFVFPSFYEGMPNTVIEAQANGLPCLISDTITKEVLLTDLIEMVSIEESPSLWKNKIKMNRERERTHYVEELKEKGYDIEDVVKTFISLIFEEEL